MTDVFASDFAETIFSLAKLTVAPLSEVELAAVSFAVFGESARLANRFVSGVASLAADFVTAFYFTGGFDVSVFTAGAFSNGPLGVSTLTELCDFTSTTGPLVSTIWWGSESTESVFVGIVERVSCGSGSGRITGNFLSCRGTETS